MNTISSFLHWVGVWLFGIVIVTILTFMWADASDKYQQEKRTAKFSRDMELQHAYDVGYWECFRVCLTNLPLQTNKPIDIEPIWRAQGNPFHK